MQGLSAFILAAKSACYVGSGEPAQPSRLGAHDLRYTDGDWSYLDSYLGGTDFLGQETVWLRDTPVWAMNYYGAVLDPQSIDGARAAEVIRAALSAMYQSGRFLGGWNHDHGPYRYQDGNSGSVEAFLGTETITHDRQVVYRLHYHGGLVRP